MKLATIWGYPISGSQLLLSFLQKPAKLHCRCCKAAYDMPIDADQTSQKTASRNQAFSFVQIAVKGGKKRTSQFSMKDTHTKKKILV